MQQPTSSPPHHPTKRKWATRPKCWSTAWSGSRPSPTARGDLRRNLVSPPPTDQPRERPIRTHQGGAVGHPSQGSRLKSREAHRLVAVGPSNLNRQTVFRATSRCCNFLEAFRAGVCRASTSQPDRELTRREGCEVLTKRRRRQVEGGRRRIKPRETLDGRMAEGVRLQEEEAGGERGAKVEGGIL